MIHPHMATLLSFLTTDALIGPRTLHNLLRAAVDASFNSRHRGRRYVYE